MDPFRHPSMLSCMALIMQFVFAMHVLSAFHLVPKALHRCAQADSC
jgi:hypothetical protein